MGLRWANWVGMWVCMEKFVCDRCGECCRNLMGLKGKALEEYEEYTPFGKFGTIYTILKPNEISSKIFEWEIPLLKRLANVKHVNLSIIPSHVVLSTEGKPIVFSWILNHNVCPFLEVNECSIYENRPLVCQSFPLYESIFGLLVGRKILKLGPLKCPRMDHIDLKQFEVVLRGGDRSRKMLATFDDVYMGSVKYDLADYMVGNHLKNLTKRGYVNMNRLSLGTVIKKCQKAVIGLFQFTLSKNLIGPDDIENIPSTLEDLSKEFL